MSNLFEIAERFQKKWGYQLWIEYRNGKALEGEDMGHFHLFIAKSDLNASEICVGLYCPPVGTTIADGDTDSSVAIYDPTSEDLALLEQRLDAIMDNEIARSQP